MDVEVSREAGKVFASLANPFGLEEADGAVADDMRNKLMFDLAYAAALEDFDDDEVLKVFETNVFGVIRASSSSRCLGSSDCTALCVTPSLAALLTR